MKMDHEVCAICLQPIKLGYNLQCKHSFCYLCLKEAMLKSCNTCPLCRHSIDLTIIENAKTSSNIHIDSNKSIWLYSGRNDGWWYYDTETDTIIEHAYQQFIIHPDKSSIDITILGKSYTIDFNDMKQRSLYATRSIKRESEIDKSQIKGIAGLQLAK